MYQEKKLLLSSKFIGENVEYNYQDKGNYFRGLLILIGKDNNIDTSERKTLLKIGEDLGFDPKFCNDAVSEFLSNEFINLQPPKFSIQTIAMNFIKDGLKLSLVDNDFHAEELEWLAKVAMENDISNEWFDKLLKQNIKDYQPKEILN